MSQIQVVMNINDELTRNDFHGFSQIGCGFLPCCGQFRSTGTRLSSWASPHPAMPLYTPPRGFIFPGTKAAYASRSMYPCYDRPCFHAFHYLNGNWGHRLGASLPLIKKIDKK